MPVTTRKTVYEAIDSERSYQDGQWPDQAIEAPNRLNIGDFILLIEEYASQARTEWSKEKRPEITALNTIRKIAGIAVNCMEQHGAPLRVVKTN